MKKLVENLYYVGVSDKSVDLFDITHMSSSMKKSLSLTVSMPSALMNGLKTSKKF